MRYDASSSPKSVPTAAKTLARKWRFARNWITAKIKHEAVSTSNIKAMRVNVVSFTIECLLRGVDSISLIVSHPLLNSGKVVSIARQYLGRQAHKHN